MKRITLTLLAGIALFTAGTANAHSSHQAHSATHQVLKKSPLWSHRHLHHHHVQRGLR